MRRKPSGWYRRRMACAMILALVFLGAVSAEAQLPPEIIDSTGLPGPMIDDFTDHTYAVRAGGVGTVVSRDVVRQFSAPIADIRVTIVAGQADDIGYVGSLQVTDQQPMCSGVGSVVAPVDVTSQVTVNGNEASLTFGAEENCCCFTGWGSATQSDRPDARLHWEVTLGGGEDYEVVFDTFIPANNVQGPPNATCGRGRARQRLYFEGDDRGFQPGGSFRTRQMVTLVPDPDVDPDGIVDGSAQNLVGETRSFAEDAVFDGVIDAADFDGELLDCHLLHDADTTDTDDMAIVPAGAFDGIVSVSLQGGPGNPLVTPSCNIDWMLILTIIEEEDETRWQLSGFHDGFPAYEIYVNGQEIYRHDPGPEPYSFLDLLGLCRPGSVTVVEEGVLP